MRLGSVNYENMLAGFMSHVVTNEIIVAANQELSLGQVFVLNENGEAVAPGAETAAEDAYGIMADAIATAGAPRKSVYYAAGEFNKHKIILPDGAAFKEYDIALRKKGIFLKDVVRAEEV